MDIDTASTATAHLERLVRLPRPRGLGIDAGLNRQEATALLARSTWVEVLGAPPLAPEILADLQAMSTMRSVAAGEPLISRHSPASELSLLARGDAALGTAHNDAPFHPERSLQAPDWLDASSAWLSGTHAQDALAVSDVQLLTVPRAALQAAMLRHPDLARRLVTVLARQVHALTAVTHDLMHKDAEGRFAAWLVQRCTLDAGSDGTGVVALHERKRDIAAQLAITPETLSRLLRHLSRKGLIDVLGYTVRVLDLAGLRALATD